MNDVNTPLQSVGAYSDALEDAYVRNKTNTNVDKTRSINKKVGQSPGRCHHKSTSGATGIMKEWSCVVKESSYITHFIQFHLTSFRLSNLICALCKATFAVAASRPPIITKYTSRSWFRLVTATVNRVV